MDHISLQPRAPDYGSQGRYTDQEVITIPMNSPPDSYAPLGVHLDAMEEKDISNYQQCYPLTHQGETPPNCGEGPDQAAKKQVQRLPGDYLLWVEGEGDLGRVPQRLIIHLILAYATWVTWTTQAT